MIAKEFDDISTAERKKPEFYKPPCSSEMAEYNEVGADPIHVFYDCGCSVKYCQTGNPYQENESCPNCALQVQIFPNISKRNQKSVEKV